MAKTGRRIFAFSWIPVLDMQADRPIHESKAKAALGLSCNQGPVLVTRACTYKCIFKEVFFSSNTKLETLRLPAHSWSCWQGSSNVQQLLMVPMSNHASPQWIQQTLICVFPVLPLRFSQGWLWWMPNRHLPPCRGFKKELEWNIFRGTPL